MRWLLALLLAATLSPLAIPKQPEHASNIQPVTAEMCIAWALHDEARGESLRGARAVLDIIQTRMNKRKLTACEVITQRHQFSGYSRGDFYKVTDSMLARYNAASRLEPIMKGCEYFHASKVSPSWGKRMIRCGSVGRHVFYKEKRSAKRTVKNR